jgi:hypothetical protein
MRGKILVIRKEEGNIELIFKGTIEFETCLAGKCYLKFKRSHSHLEKNNELQIEFLQVHMCRFWNKSI